MQRALAARHGVAYVHLAVFAIDVDRLHRVLGDTLPLGWEVLLTERYLRHVGAGVDAQMVEDACRAAMEPGDALGGQLPFAVYRATRAGTVPFVLDHVFRSWHSLPDQLMAALDVLDSADPALIARLATTCIEASLDPPIAEPTRDALRAMT
jgi:hypothetical protein